LLVASGTDTSVANFQAPLDEKVQTASDVGQSFTSLAGTALSRAQLRVSK
jgi:hypothetical protein